MFACQEVRILSDLYTVFRFYCSGGCAANSYNFKGKIDDVYEVGCELERKRVECAIMIKAAMAEEEV